MNQFWDSLASGGSIGTPLEIVLRLAVAAVLGGVVALVYRMGRAATDAGSFPATLILLAILIAMVTQVIGDNVARAFSLVGALSIVRFRTVVRDTEDTAYVIFAVVVGMAVGASALWVAVLGIAVIAVVAMLLKRPGIAPTVSDVGYRVTVRIAVGFDAGATVEAPLREHARSWRLQALSTARQGTSVEVSYDVQMEAAASAESLVKTLNRLDGVQSVELERRVLRED